MKIREIDSFVGECKVFSFMGYEPNELGGFDDEESPINRWVKFSIKVMISHLSKLHDNVVFISGCSPGTEMWSSEEVIHLRSFYPERNIRLVTALPGSNMSGRDDSGTPIGPRPWPLSSHNRMQKVLSEADGCVYTSSDKITMPLILERDKWVLAHSYGALFVMDDTERNIRIQSALVEAESVGLQCCVINPVSEKIYIA